MTVENGTAERTGECDYKIRVTKPGTTLIFLIKGKDTLSRTPYRVKSIPDPVTTPGSRGNNWLSLDSLRSQSGLLATVKNSDFNFDFSVVSFEITVIRYKKLSGSRKIYCSECVEKIEKDHYETVFSGINEGADFNDTLKAFIRHKLMRGDKVFIDGIKVRGPDNQIRHLNSISFKMQ